MKSFGDYHTAQIEHALANSLQMIRIYTDSLKIEIEAATYVGVCVADRDALKAALIKSVALQSELAGLINSRDGGARMQFDAEEWLQRLQADYLRPGEPYAAWRARRSSKSEPSS